jgi:hypothetical protein
MDDIAIDQVEAAKRLEAASGRPCSRCGRYPRESPTEQTYREVIHEQVAERRRLERQVRDLEDALDEVWFTAAQLWEAAT